MTKIKYMEREKCHHSPNTLLYTKYTSHNTYVMHTSSQKRHTIIPNNNVCNNDDDVDQSLSGLSLPFFFFHLSYQYF